MTDTMVPLVDISHLTGDTGGLQAHPVVHPRIPEATLRHIVDLAFNAVHPGAIPNLLNSLEQTHGTTQAGYYVGRIIGDGYSVGAKRLASELEAAGSELLTPEDVALAPDADGYNGQVARARSPDGSTTCTGLCAGAAC